MLEKWIETLEREKQLTIAKVREVCGDEKIIDLAIKEINANYVTTKNFLTRMANSGFKVNDNLSRVNEDYNKYVDYRRLMNHVEHHLAAMLQIPIEVEKGKFEPRFARFY